MVGRALRLSAPVVILQGEFKVPNGKYQTLLHAGRVLRQSCSSFAAALWMGSGVLNAVAGRGVAKKAGNR